MLCMRMCRYDGGGARDAGGCRHSGSDRSERTHSEALSASKPDHWSAGKQQWHRDHQIPGAVTGLPVSRCTCQQLLFYSKIDLKVHQRTTALNAVPLGRNVCNYIFMQHYVYIFVFLFSKNIKCRLSHWAQCQSNPTCERADKLGLWMWLRVP